MLRHCEQEAAAWQILFSDSVACVAAELRLHHLTRGYGHCQDFTLFLLGSLTAFSVLRFITSASSCRGLQRAERRCWLVVLPSESNRLLRSSLAGLVFLILFYFRSPFFPLAENKAAQSISRRRLRPSLILSPSSNQCVPDI